MDCLITLAILSGILYFNRGRVRRLLWGYDPGEPRTLEVPWEPVQEQEKQDDPADRLARLHELYEKGVLTEEEYQRKKEELLDQM